MAKVVFKRLESSEELENLPIVDGAIYVTKDKKMYVDYGEERIEVGDGSGSGGGGAGETLPIGSEIDYDGETVPTGWEQVDEAPVYSTTETVCGTWIDGKPIYRKVINFTNTSTDWQTIDTINNIGEIIRLNGYVYDSGDNKTAIPSYGNDSVQFYIDTSGNIRKKSTSYYSNKTGTIILEYTKTTD